MRKILMVFAMVAALAAFGALTPDAAQACIYPEGQTPLFGVCIQDCECATNCCRAAFGDFMRCSITGCYGIPESPDEGGGEPSQDLMATVISEVDGWQVVIATAMIVTAPAVPPSQ